MKLRTTTDLDIDADDIAAVMPVVVVVVAALYLIFKGSLRAQECRLAQGVDVRLPG